MKETVARHEAEINMSDIVPALRSVMTDAINAAI